MITFSYSRVSSYRACPQKYNYGYIENLEPNKKSRPLCFGSDFHKLLESRINGTTVECFAEIKKGYEDLTPTQQEDLGSDYLDDLWTVFTDYNKRWAKSRLADQAEHEFHVPMGTYKGESVVFHGIIDELYFSKKTGELVALGEHKTFSQKPDKMVLAMNEQINLYAKAAEKIFGVMPKRVRWDYIKSTPAQEPVWLEKSGRFSEASNSNITPDSWLKACNKRGITDEAILSKASNYEPNLDNFFFRCDLEIYPDMANTIWEDFKTTTKEILKNGYTNTTKNISRDCSWCNYCDLCYGRFTGADINYIKEKDYRIKER